MLWSLGVATGRMSLGRFVEMTSSNAAKLFGMYPQKGCIAPGSDADLVIWDPTESRIIDGATMHSKAGYSPYDGWEVTGWPTHTHQPGRDRGRGIAGYWTNQAAAWPFPVSPSDRPVAGCGTCSRNGCGSNRPTMMNQ